MSPSEPQVCFKSSLFSYQLLHACVAKACIAHTRQRESTNHSPDDSNQIINPRPINLPHEG